MKRKYWRQGTPEKRSAKQDIVKVDFWCRKEKTDEEGSERESEMERIGGRKERKGERGKES